MDNPNWRDAFVASSRPDPPLQPAPTQYAIDQAAAAASPVTDAQYAAILDEFTDYDAYNPDAAQDAEQAQERVGQGQAGSDNVVQGQNLPAPVIHNVTAEEHADNLEALGWRAEQIVGELERGRRDGLFLPSQHLNWVRSYNPFMKEQTEFGHFTFNRFNGMSEAENAMSVEKGRRWGWFSATIDGAPMPT